MEKEKEGGGDLQKIDIFGRSEEEVRVGPFKEASE